MAEKIHDKNQKSPSGKGGPGGDGSQKQGGGEKPRSDWPKKGPDQKKK